MRKLLTLWIALAAVVGISASSFGGSMMLLGVGKPAGGAVGPPTFTYQNDDVAWSGTGTSIVTSQTLGTGTVAVLAGGSILAICRASGSTAFSSDYSKHRRSFK